MEKNLYEVGKGRYQDLYNYFANEDEGIGTHFSEEELKDIIYRAGKAGQIDENVGLNHERCKDNESEKVFQEHWQKENLPLGWINRGHGILQDLFIESNPNPLSPISGGRWIEEINKRDRMIVATVIQWLGTNCGWCFLGEVFEKLGYRITKIEKK